MAEQGIIIGRLWVGLLSLLVTGILILACGAPDEEIFHAFTGEAPIDCTEACKKIIGCGLEDDDGQDGCIESCKERADARELTCVAASSCDDIPGCFGAGSSTSDTAAAQAVVITEPEGSTRETTAGDAGSRDMPGGTDGAIRDDEDEGV